MKHEFGYVLPAMVAALVVGCARDTGNFEGERSEPQQTLVVASSSTAVSPRSHSAAVVPNERVVQSAMSIAGAFSLERVIVDPVTDNWHPESVKVGDFTGDQLPDVVLLVSYSGLSYQPVARVLRIFAQRADGTLAPPVDHPIENSFTSDAGLALADLDADGRNEVVIGLPSALVLVRRLPDGRLESTRVPASKHAVGLEAFDADGDGLLDLFGQTWSEGAEIHHGDGRGGISHRSLLSTAPFGYNTIGLADFTQDGHADLVMYSGQGWPKVWIHPLLPSHGLQASFELDLRPAQAWPSFGLDVSDIDHDGRVDLVVASDGPTQADQGVRIFYRGDGRTFTRSVLLSTPRQYERPGALAVADMDGNGLPDIVMAFNSHDALAYALQFPDGFAPYVVVRTDDNPWTNNPYIDDQLVIADVSSDGCPDIILAERSSSLRIFYGRNCTVPPQRTGGRGQATQSPG
jgi:hypothetical protein